MVHALKDLFIEQYCDEDCYHLGNAYSVQYVITLLYSPH